MSDFKLAELDLNPFPGKLEATFKPAEGLLNLINSQSSVNTQRSLDLYLDECHQRDEKRVELQEGPRLENITERSVEYSRDDVSRIFDTFPRTDYDQLSIEEALRREKEKSEQLEIRLQRKDQLIGDMTRLQNELCKVLEDAQKQAAVYKKQSEDEKFELARQLEILSQKQGKDHDHQAILQENAQLKSELQSLRTQIRDQQLKISALTDELQSSQTLDIIKQELEVTTDEELLSKIKETSYLQSASRLKGRLQSLIQEYIPNSSSPPNNSQIWKWVVNISEKYMKLRKKQNNINSVLNKLNCKQITDVQQTVGRLQDENRSLNLLFQRLKKYFGVDSQMSAFSTPIYCKMEGHIKRKFSQQGSPHLPHCYICSVPFTATNKKVICKKCNNSCCKPHCLNVSKTSNGLICEICHRFKIRLTMLRSMGIDLQKMQNSLFELYDRKEIIEADLAKQDIQIKRLQINISTVTEEQQSVYNGLQEKINNEMAKAEGYIGVSEKLYQALNSSAESEQARKQKLVKLQREKEHVLQQTSEIQAKIDLLSVDVQVKHNRLTQQHQLGKIKDQLCSICRNKLKNRRRSLSNYQSSRNASIRKSETISCSFLCCGRKI